MSFGLATIAGLLLYLPPVERPFTLPAVSVSVARIRLLTQPERARRLLPA